MPFLQLPQGINSLYGPFFGDDFESGNTNRWDAILYASSLITHVDNQDDNGKSIQISLPGDVGPINRIRLVKNFPSGVNRQKLSFTFEPKNSASQQAMNMRLCQGQTVSGGAYFLEYGLHPIPSIRLRAFRNNNTALSGKWCPLNLNLGMQQIEIEWWAGVSENPIGGTRLSVNGQLVDELTNITNYGMVLDNLMFGSVVNTVGISGEFIFDDLLIQNADDLTLTHTVDFGNSSGPEEKVFFGWLSNPELGFDIPGQTGLYVEMGAGNFQIKQTNRQPGILAATITSGSFIYPVGAPINAAFTFHPNENTVSLTIDGQVLVNRLPVAGELDTWLLQKAGFYFAGQELRNHQVNDFGLRSQGWPVTAHDDQFQIHEDELFTVDLRDNDLGSQGIIPQIIQTPSLGQVLVNTDGTVTYKAHQAGDDQFAYVLRKDGIVSKGLVGLKVSPRFGPNENEPIPMVRTFFDDFESRTTTSWTTLGDPTLIKLPKSNPIAGNTHLRFINSAEQPQQIRLRHTEIKGRNYVGVNFKFRPENLSFGPGETKIRVLQIRGEVQPLCTLEYRIDPVPQVRLRGTANPGASDRFTEWVSLDPNLDHQTIEIAWWGSHPGFEGSGFRLGLNGVEVSEETAFKFREETMRHVDFGFTNAPLSGLSGAFSIDEIVVWRSAYVTEFVDDFEAPNSSWDVLNDSSQLSTFTPQNPLTGNGSFAVDQPGGSNERAYLRNDLANSTRFRMQVKLATDTVTMNTGDYHSFLDIHNDSGDVLLRSFYRHSPQPQVVLKSILANGSWASTGWNTVDPNITNTGILFESEWWSATPFETNGSLRLWLDGENTVELNNLNHSSEQVARYLIGVAVGLDQDTQGTFLFDDFRWWSYQVRE